MSMLSWISVVLSGFISISAYENQKLKQAIFFRIFSLLLLTIIVWEQHSHATPEVIFYLSWFGGVDVCAWTAAKSSLPQSQLCAVFSRATAV